MDTMKTRLFFLIPAWVIGWMSILLSQGPFIATYPAGDWTSGRFVTACPHPGAGYLVLASANSWQQGTRTSLFRVDTQGDTLWTKAFWRHDLGDRWPIDMAAATDGSGFYILLGNGIPTIQYNTVMKVDPQGDSLWQTVVSNNSDQWVNAPFNSIEALQNGGCVVAGNGYFFDNPPLVTALDGDGDIIWNNALSPAGAYSHYKKIRQSSDGHMFAVGTHSSYDPGANHSRLMISKFTADGLLLWSRQFNAGTPDAGDKRLSEGYDVLPLADGGCIITGYMTDPGITFQGQTLVKRLDQDGNDVWTKTWFSSLNDLSTGFNLLANGSDHFLVYLHRHGSTAAGATLMKCTMDGDSIWTQYGWDYPIRMTGADPSGYLLFTGYIPSTPYGTFIRTAPDGTFLPPSLQDPWNGQSNLTMPLTFKWNSMNAPQVTRQYDFQLALEPTFDPPQLQLMTDGSPDLILDNLIGQTTYYWRVRARGTELHAGIWSEPSHFTTGEISAIGPQQSVNGVQCNLIYPQPASGQVFVDLSLARPAQLLITVLDPSGHATFQHDRGSLQAGNYLEIIPVADWPDGVYLMTILVDGKVLTRTLLVQH